MGRDRERRSDDAGDRSGPAEPAPDAGETRYRTGEGGDGGETATEGSLAEIAEEEPEPEARLLDRVPENVVPLGAGSLFTSTLLSGGACLVALWGLTTGRYFGFEPFQITLAVVQWGFATMVQGAGVYFARKRTRWLVVMLGAAAGVLSIVGLPFAILAALCLGLGKNHFAMTTPADYIDTSGGDDD